MSSAASNRTDQGHLKARSFVGTSQCRLFLVGGVAQRRLIPKSCEPASCITTRMCTPVGPRIAACHGQFQDRVEQNFLLVRLVLALEAGGLGLGLDSGLDHLDHCLGGLVRFIGCWFRERHGGLCVMAGDAGWRLAAGCMHDQIRSCFTPLDRSCDLEWSEACTLQLRDRHNTMGPQR
jgi:hypothetical protein